MYVNVVSGNRNHVNMKVDENGKLHLTCLHRYIGRVQCTLNSFSPLEPIFLHCFGLKVAADTHLITH